MRLTFSYSMIPLFLLAFCLSSPAAVPPAGSLLYPQQNCKVEFVKDQKSYTFTYTDSEGSYQYEVIPDRTTNRVGTLSVRCNVNKETRLSPIFFGGVIIRDASNQFFTPEERDPFSNKTESKDWLENNRLHLQKTTLSGGKEINREYIFSLKGKTLIIEASANCVGAATDNIAGFDFGRSRFMRDPSVHRLPSVPLPLIQTHKDLFMSLYVDPFLSSLGKYDISASNGSSVTITATNTPAYFLVDSEGNVPDLHVTSYLTISHALKDTLPVVNPKTNPMNQRIRDSVIMDLHENTLANPASGLLQMIRRWDAPDDGIVNLDGAVSLQQGKKAAFEVHFTQALDNKDHVLFSQILDQSQKPSTGIHGQFLVSKGDQLRFVTYGPAVMTGGIVGLNIQIKQNKILYSSINDFSSTQGQDCWYYEWQSHQGNSLMLWNPKTLRWEQPDTRAYQTATGMVTRVGQNGDAFQSANHFINSLNTLGIHNLAFILRDWSNHASSDFSAGNEKDATAWGTKESYKQITQSILDAGNQLIQAIPKPATKAATLTKHKENLLRQIQAAQKTNPFSALLFPVEVLANPGDPLFNNPEAKPTGEQSSRVAWFASQHLVDEIKSQTKLPVFAWGGQTTGQIDPYLTPLVDGLFDPIDPQSNSRNLVDEEVMIGRKNGTRIGLGTYSDFLEDKEEKIIDPRMFPFDQYWTTTIAYARVPYFSDYLWYPNLTPRDLRATMMEFTNLLQPVAKEYLNPKNEVKDILYYYDNIESATTEQVLNDEKQDKATRVKIEYSNQLTIHANRSASRWKLDVNSLSDYDIDRDGFMAENPQSKLFAIVGIQGYQHFSACFTPTTSFLHSRNGAMLTFHSIATDGMVKLSDSPFEGKKDIACLFTRELRNSDLTPILLSNTRIDAAIHWLDLNTLEIKFLDCNEPSALLELYCLPQTWFHQDNKGIKVTSKNGDDKEKTVYFTNISDNGQKGIRIPEAKVGDVLRIAFTP